jgi:hypothetical protein
VEMKNPAFWDINGLRGTAFQKTKPLSFMSNFNFGGGLFRFHLLKRRNSSN